MTNPEQYRICDCGNKIPPPRNSTIWAKKCTNCQYKDVYDKKSKSKNSFFTGKKTKPNKGKTERQKAIDLADKWFSWYIRLKYSHPSVFGNPVCRCFTCNNIHDIKIIENGHYHSRENKATRYHENNARPQCTHCNQHKHGKHTEFGNNLLGQIGFEEFEELRKLALSTGEDNEIFYREQAKIYRLKFNELLKERKISNPWKN